MIFNFNFTIKGDALPGIMFEYTREPANPQFEVVIWISANSTLGQNTSSKGQYFLKHGRRFVEGDTFGCMFDRQ